MSIQYSEETSLPLGRSPESKEAAVAVAEAFLEGTQADEDVEAAPVAAVPVVAPSSPEAPQPPAEPAPAAVEPSFDFTAFEPNLTPDLADLLEDEPPDFEAEARAEIAAELQAAEDNDEYVEPVDQTQAAKERALQKRVEFLEGRLVETNRGKWVQENLRAYPLLKEYAADEVKAIQATSRRAFAREAATLNARVTRIAKPLLDDLKAKLEARGDEITTERRAQVDASWGKPAIDPAATGAGAEQVRRIQDARKREDLHGVIRAMIDPS